MGPAFRKVSKWGTVEPNALSTEAVRLIVKAHAEVAGVKGTAPEPVSPHSLRAGFVTQAYANGLDDETRETQAQDEAERQNMLKLTDKVVFLTGCGSQAEGWGNGKCIAVLFARQGAKIYGIDINEAAATETKRIIESEGGTCVTASGDVTDAAQVNALVADCMARFGRIDILVNNVGASAPGDPATMEESLWDAQIDLNLKSAFLCCKAILPIMEGQGKGAVVNIASTAGVRYTGKPQAGYAAAKAGLIQFSKVTAVDYARRGVRLNCVLPGLMNTPLVQKVARQFASENTGKDYESFVNRRHNQVPMGHMGEGWDVAHAALFLASDEAKYITATELLVDGGLCAAVRD
jgi:NAD(P)-dependent dehydrogenase (short-subunit alcohol dehydrogenase family)